MSDPTEHNKDEPHPASSHRTPVEIAKDEAGPIGGKPNDPDKKLPGDDKKLPADDKKLPADNGPLVKPPVQPAGSKSGLKRRARSG